MPVGSRVIRVGVSASLFALAGCGSLPIGSKAASNAPQNDMLLQPDRLQKTVQNHQVNGLSENEFIYYVPEELNQAEYYAELSRSAASGWKYERYRTWRRLTGMHQGQPPCTVVVLLQAGKIPIAQLNTQNPTVATGSAGDDPAHWTTVSLCEYEESGK